MQVMWRGGATLGCESYLCHSFSPCMCWHTYMQPLGPRRTAAYRHQTLCAHRVGTHPLLPSSTLGQRWGSWHQGHFSRSETLGSACFHDTSNSRQGRSSWQQQDPQWACQRERAIRKTFCLFFLAAPRSMWGLSSLSKDRTRSPYIGSM